MITKPIHRSVKLAEKIAEGDLSLQVDVQSTDETGQLLQAMKTMQEKLVVTIQTDIPAVVGAAARGDLSHRISLDDQHGFYRDLAQGLNELMDVNDRAIKDTGDVIGAMAAGDLTKTIDAEYEGSFKRIKESVNQMQRRLSQVIEHDIQAIVRSAVDGDLEHRIDLEDKQGFYQELSISVNELVDINNRMIIDTIEVVGAMASRINGSSWMTTKN